MAILESIFIDQANALIKKLLNIIGHEIHLAWGLPTELQNLQDMLRTLSGMLAGVLGKPTTNEFMIMWLKKIKTVVYDAEDLFDKWSYEKLEKNIKIQTTMTKAKEKLKTPYSYQDRAHRVERLLKSIQDIFDDANKYGIKPVEVGAREVYEQSGGEREQKLIDQRQFVHYKSLFGREDDLKQIVALLEDAGKTKATLNVIGIVGMAGMGKTALSKEVTDKVRKLFDQVISVTVSHDYKLSVILKRIAGKVMTQDQSLITAEAEEIVLKVKEKLERKKYLLVLDDVWDTLGWEPLQAALLGIGGREGTTILVTSREKVVVEKLTTDGLLSIHTLRKLSEADSWSLFKDRLSRPRFSADEQLIEGSERKDIAKRMVSKCGGLPLALKLLGDLLRNYSDMEKWRDFDQSEAWKTNDDHYILPSLKLSYMYLKDPALKTCFSYCAIFGEDEEIEKDDLVRLWMAQGFLQPQDHMLMEVLGEEYFGNLLNSSLFHEPVFDRLGNVRKVKMHDLVRALASDISKEDIWCCGQNEIESGSYNKFRHISVPPEYKDDVYPTNCYKLRTFLTSKKVLSIDFLKECKNLRALSFCLGPDSRLKEKDWKVLGDLIHLRFLEIMFDEEVSADRVKEIIESELFPHISKLYHLQTLITFTCNDDSIDVDDYNVVIPKQLGNLVNLRHLLLHGQYLDTFERLGLFTALQTLPKFRFDKERESGRRENKRIKLGSNEGGKLSELQLKNLRGRLVLEDLSCINEQEARSLCLEEKPSLTSLEMKIILENEIMEALKPHRSVIGLIIEEFYGTELPTWLTGSGHFSNLVFLELVSFEGVQGELNLRTLNSLRVLRITECSQLTVEFNEFAHCSQLTELDIRNCDEVVSIPDMSPLTNLRKLTVLYQKLNTTLRCSNLSLTYLYTHGYLLPNLNPNDHLCQSLMSLSLDAAANEDKSLPDQMQHFVALQHLTIFSFSIIETLPEFIGNLTSLTTLDLRRMTKLRYLPSKDAMNHLSNLTTVRFYSCPELEEKKMRENEEWLKICHLPNIRFDDNSYGDEGRWVSTKKFLSTNSGFL